VYRGPPEVYRGPCMKNMRQKTPIIFTHVISSSGEACCELLYPVTLLLLY